MQNKKESQKATTMTVKELTDEFVKCRVSLKLVQESTIETDRFLINKINSTMGNIVVCKLKRQDIEKAIQELRDQGSSEYRLFRIFGKLKQILEMAIDDDIILKNPCRGIKMRKHDEFTLKKKERLLSAQEIQRLEHILYLNPKTGTYVAMYIALLTGMRRGEILALQ